MVKWGMRDWNPGHGMQGAQDAVTVSLLVALAVVGTIDNMLMLGPYMQDGLTNTRRVETFPAAESHSSGFAPLFPKFGALLHELTWLHGLYVASSAWLLVGKPSPCYPCYQLDISVAALICCGLLWGLISSIKHVESLIKRERHLLSKTSHSGRIAPLVPTDKVLFLKLYSVWPSMNPHFFNVRIGYRGAKLPTCGQVNLLLQPRNTMDPPTQRHDEERKGRTGDEKRREGSGALLLEQLLERGPGEEEIEERIGGGAQRILSSGEYRTFLFQLPISTKMKGGVSLVDRSLQPFDTYLQTKMRRRMGDFRKPESKEESLTFGVSDRHDLSLSLRLGYGYDNEGSHDPFMTCCRKANLCSTSKGLNAIDTSVYVASELITWRVAAMHCMGFYQVDGYDSLMQLIQSSCLGRASLNFDKKHG
ncbi:hypothetical protein VNO77_19661 [Canavalia gladiata]|uniref:Uncharacterized protein n=1 Tax=Canavalia gladiata TaxID=3824 RepID=A0AAN9LRY4_CANGL